MTSSGINKVLLVGNICKDGTVRDYKQQQFLHFTLATEESFKKSGEQLTRCEFHHVKIPVLWVNNNFDNFNKGRLIYIEGKIHTNSSIDSAGIKRYQTEVWVYQYRFLN